MDLINVPYQIDVYGKHPRDFHFNFNGRRVRAVHGPKDHFWTISDSASLNLRREIWGKTLREGAAWETSTVEIIARISKASKKKFPQSALGD